MKEITHSQQKKIWNKEHKKPYLLLSMDSKDASSGVKLFWKWLKEKCKSKNLKGIEMGCGKGRNTIWLAQRGVTMSAFDFSIVAVREARCRAKEAGVENKVEFIQHDATKRWPSPSNYFDFGIDCFASTDIETYKGRTAARNQFIRVLKPDGYLLVYTLSTDDEYPKEMLKQSPARERNSLIHPVTGKFEKVFDREELLDFYKSLRLVKERRINKKTRFFNKEYKCKHFWMIFQKI